MIDMTNLNGVLKGGEELNRLDNITMSLSILVSARLFIQMLLSSDLEC